MPETTMDIEPIVEEWYEYLAKGEMKGLKCKECGTVMFPPTPVCRACGCMDTEWVDEPGTGHLVSVTLSPQGIPYHSTEPCVSGWAVLDDGNRFCAVLDDVDREGALDLIARMHDGEVRIELYVAPLDGGYYFPRMRVVS